MGSDSLSGTIWPLDVFQKLSGQECISTEARSAVFLPSPPVSLHWETAPEAQADFFADLGMIISPSIQVVPASPPSPLND